MLDSYNIENIIDAPTGVPVLTVITVILLLCVVWFHCTDKTIFETNESLNKKTEKHDIKLNAKA